AATSGRGLPGPPAARRVGAAHPAPRPPRRPQEPGQARSVGAGALHPDPATGPNPDSQPSSPRYPAEVVANSATPSSPPTASSAAATLRSKCVSTPPVTGRAASTMVTVIPSAWSVSRDGAAARQRGGGAIALLAQGDPPHYRPC